MNDIAIKPYSNPATGLIDLYIWKYGHRGRTNATALTWSDVPDGAHVLPTLSLNLSSGQELIDLLWSCGLRPTEGSGSAGSLAATQKHLDDMRKIAGKMIEIEL